MSDYKLLSLLLQYPTAELHAAGLESDEVGPFLDWWSHTPLDELQASYVETFDFQRRHALYLTYHGFGDRRQRGMALLALKQRYAAAGLRLLDGELPDYLPVVLEACAIAPELGVEILARHREPIELVRSSLHAEGSPWAPLLDAVVTGLPALTRRQVAKVRRMAEHGPPEEEVGLEPFAPPEVVPR